MLNKAQMEIFGLVIIVILISIGLLFAIVILTKEPSREVQRVKESVQAANFLNTIVWTTSLGCGKRTVKGLLQDCSLTNSFCDDGLTHTCDLAHEMIVTMLDTTLGEWGKNYKFYINGTQNVEHITAEAGTCKGEREGHTKTEKVTPGLDIELTLFICQES